MQAWTPTALARPWLADPRHGPLPALLVLLTVNTGAVDAVSILRLGRVFVGNMTGNVVFVGFALARAPGFSLSASLSALAGFVVGALAGGVIARRHRGHRGRLLAAAILVELALLVAALLMSALSGAHLATWQLDLLAATAAVALGLQNAAVRALAVPDLTTTVVTMTLTGIAADLPADRQWPVVTRRVIAVVSMLVGALVGALLVLHAGRTSGLALSVGLVALTAASATVVARGDRPWHRAAG